MLVSDLWAHNNNNNILDRVLANKSTADGLQRRPELRLQRADLCEPLL